MKLRPEIDDGVQGDARMSLHDAAFGRKGAGVVDACSDPERFASITHPSGPLVELMARIAARLSAATGADTPAVWRLDQPMGSGKSHCMVALWHLAAHRHRIAGSDLGHQVADTAATIGGDGAGDFGAALCVVLDCDNTSHTPNGHTPARSLGERFLWRLFEGDARAFGVYRHHLASKAKLSEAMRSVDRPVLILVDEVMDYIRVAAAADDGAAVTDMGFLRALLDAVHTVDRCAAVVTMIGAEHDHMALTAQGQQCRDELEHLLTRNAASVAVGASGDSAEIIQRRLFEHPADDETVASVADWFATSAQAEWAPAVFDNLAGDYSRGGFRRRLQRCYPFHPELIDLIENEWPLRAGFQRARSMIGLLAATVREHAARAAEGLWAPPLIGSGDLVLDSAPVRDALLGAGLLTDAATQAALREMASIDIADAHQPQRGTARRLDTARAARHGAAAAVNPHAAQRIATAMFVRSVCPRPSGHHGASEPELLAASFVPDRAYSPGDAEAVLQSLAPPDGLISVSVTGDDGNRSPRRWRFETRHTLAAMTRSAQGAVTAALSDAAIAERAFAAALSGPFDDIITVDSGPAPSSGTKPETRRTVLRGAQIDRKLRTRLIVLDPRWFALSGDGSTARDCIEAALGVGDDAFSVQWASSAVFACADETLRDQARSLASRWLACCSVAAETAVRCDPDLRRLADGAQHEALARLDRQVRVCYRHIVYLAPAGEHGRKAEFKRIRNDDLTALDGNDVWAELRAASKAAHDNEFGADMLMHSLRRGDYNKPLNELRDSFWNNPRKPLLSAGEPELAAALYDAAAARKLRLAHLDGTPYDPGAASDIDLSSATIRVHSAGHEPAASPRSGRDTSRDAAIGPTQPSTAPPGTPIETPTTHWMSNTNLNIPVGSATAATVGHFLRHLAHAIEEGDIVHINQLTSVTIAGSRAKAEQIDTLAVQAGGASSITHLEA